uniref:Phospholipase A22 n=1 Tax=Plukenetia volubilis TaxID=316893 RepID=A0A0H3YGY8_9ROSI|nr:phospholipase A22 [Plukenetia volubilis]
MHSDKDLGVSLKFNDAILLNTIEKQEQTSHFDYKVLGWSFLPFVPSGINTKVNVRTPIAINKGFEHSETDLGTIFKPTNAVLSRTSTAIEKPKQKIHFDIKFLGWSLLSLLPWTINANDSIRTPPATINRGLKRRARSRGAVENGESLRFRPYVSKVPWHTGPRGFLSLLFPRYGHYCGPNWSSGKDGGSPVWDKRPIDWLDYCCYCHDMGYDTDDQARLLKADLQFLECLERPRVTSKGDTGIACVYKTMCITGMRSNTIFFLLYDN